MCIYDDFNTVFYSRPNICDFYSDKIYKSINSLNLHLKAVLKFLLWIFKFLEHLKYSPSKKMRHFIKIFSVLI